MSDGKDVSSLRYGPQDYPSGAYGKGPVAITFNDTTVEARSFYPNRFGLYQTHGNVWEHCLDAGPVDYSLIPEDGRPYLGDAVTRVIRGGAWSHNPAICRSAYRDGMQPGNNGWDGRVGFRVAMDLA